jgi:hypothetical protein
MHLSIYFIHREKYCVVANIVTLLTKIYSKRMKLILPSWIYKCIAAQSCLPFEEEDYFYIVETVPSMQLKIITRTFLLLQEESFILDTGSDYWRIIPYSPDGQVSCQRYY